MKTVKKILSIAALCVAGFLFLRVHSNGRSIGISEPRGQAAVSECTVNEPQASVPIRAPVALIQGGEETPVPWTSRTPAAKRVRRIFPDTSWMTPEPSLQAGDLIRLELFDDAVFEAEIRNVTRYVNGAVGMTAHLRNGEEGVVYLSYFERALSVTAELISGDKYAIQFTGEGHYAIEVDKENSDILPGGSPLNTELFLTGSELGGGLAGMESLSAEASQDPVTIDVMVVYTPSAKNWAATNGVIETIIASAMQKANNVHSNSDTRVRLHLIHSAEISYAESGSSDTDLNRLTDMADGYMDTVHSWRNDFNADLVCLLANVEDAGGLAWPLDKITGRRTYGFSLVRIKQANSYTLVHELGHNMGAHHHKAQTSQPGPQIFHDWPDNKWSAGWRWTGTNGSRYCSVMTYVDGKFFSDGLTHIQQPYFSNPQILHQGVPAGDPQDGDNSRTLRGVRYAIADYRLNPDVIRAFPYTNSFELGFIDWNYDRGTALWKRCNGIDNNLNTAVSGGYSGTTNAVDGDFFLFIDAETNKTAFLEARFDFSELESAEVSFSYYMFAKVSSLMGSLSLHVSTNAGTTWIQLWKKSGNQGSGWKSATVDLTAYAGRPEVSLRFQADTQSNWLYTYIMLDHLVIDGVYIPDLDYDGIPNWWEEQYYGGKTNAVATNLAANARNTILEAYIAGLNPTNPSSFFRVNSFEPEDAEGFVMSWNATSGRVYSVQWSTNLLNGFQPLQTNIFWPQASYTDTVHGVKSKGFYKIGVRMAE